MFGTGVGFPAAPSVVLHGGHVHLLVDVGLGVVIGLGVVLAFLAALRWWAGDDHTDGRRSGGQTG